MIFNKCKVSDVVKTLNKTVNPQKSKDMDFIVYSLPAFDNNKTSEFLKGREINSNKILLDEKCILFNKLNLKFKRVWRYNEILVNGICSMEYIPLVCDKEKVDFNFLYYYITNDMFYSKLLGNVSGTSNSHQRIHKEDLLEKDIFVPNLVTQKKISKILSDIDRKIDLNNEINNNLRELCKTNYLRLIENNSNELSLSKLMDYQGGSQPPASEFQKEKSEDNVRFVQIRDFETDSYMCYIPNSKKNKLCNKDDILIARYGASLGRICYGLSGAYNVALAKVLSKKEEYKELLRVILESDDFYNYINQVGQRSAQAGFNAGDIAGYTVIIPDENGLKEFNSISKNVIEKRLLIIDENRKLSELRDTLLPKLMNGEIDLDNIDI